MKQFIINSGERSRKHIIIVIDKAKITEIINISFVLF